jgi:hypothetical protein
MATANEIRHLHSAIQDRVVQLTGHRTLEIHPSSDDWTFVSALAVISFDIYSDGYSQFAEREIGGYCPVFPLKADCAYEDNQAWVSWHEEWQCVGNRRYDLIGAGWTFFFGICGRLTKGQQRFRAEWDETEYRGREALQPHWHFDAKFTIGYTTRAIPLAQGSSLVELPSTVHSGSGLYEISPAEGFQEMRLDKLHFGMGGWANHEEHPYWWQCHVGENLNALADWAGRTLQAIIVQLDEKQVVKDKIE